MVVDISWPFTRIGHGRNTISDRKQRPLEQRAAQVPRTGLPLPKSGSPLTKILVSFDGQGSESCFTGTSTCGLDQLGPDVTRLLSKEVLPEK